MDEMLDPKEKGGWYGLFDAIENKIWINLSAWKGTTFDEDWVEQEKPLSVKHKENVTEREVEEDIIETIMHESGHAAALSRDHADLSHEIEEWVLSILSTNAPENEELNAIRPHIGGVIDYLVHEYIAAICERREQPTVKAMRNAWDQTVGARFGDFKEMTNIFGRMGAGWPDGRLGHAEYETRLNTSWEFAEHILSIMHKYFNKMSNTIFTAYKEGISHREKKELEFITGEEVKPGSRGTTETLYNPERSQRIRDEETEDWKDKLRGR